MGEIFKTIKPEEKRRALYTLVMLFILCMLLLFGVYLYRAGKIFSNADLLKSIVQQIAILLILTLSIAGAIFIKPIRRTIGLLFVILGTLSCLTIIGITFGVPMIIAGGLLLFI